MSKEIEVLEGIKIKEAVDFRGIEIITLEGRARLTAATLEQIIRLNKYLRKNKKDMWQANDKILHDILQVFYNE